MNEYNYIESPTDENKYAHIYQLEIKEKNMEKTIENLEKLFEEHENMFIAYKNNVTRPNEEKSHLERALVILDKLSEKMAQD